MLIKIIASGIACCIICILMKRTAKEYVIFVQLCFAVTVGVLIIKEGMNFLSEMSAYFDISGSFGDLFTVLYKGAFICIACKIVTDICIESGNILVGDVIELAGKTVMLTLCLPLIKDIIKTAVSFVL